MLDRQVAFIEAGDLSGLLAPYDPDVVLVRFDTVARGLAHVEAIFRAYLERGPRLARLLACDEADDVLTYRAVMAFGDEQFDTLGTFVFRGGRIWRETAAVLGPVPPQ